MFNFAPASHESSGFIRDTVNSTMDYWKVYCSVLLAYNRAHIILHVACLQPFQASFCHCLTTNMCPWPSIAIVPCPSHWRACEQATYYLEISQSESVLPQAAQALMAYKRDQEISFNHKTRILAKIINLVICRVKCRAILARFTQVSFFLDEHTSSFRSLWH